MSLFLFLTSRPAYFLPGHPMSSRVWDPGPGDLCICASVSPLALGSGSLGCLRGFSEVLSQQGRHQACPRDVTDLQKPQLSNKTQRLLSCGRQTCSPGPCPPALPAIELIRGWGHGFPRSGVWPRAGAALLPVPTSTSLSPPLKPQTPLSLVEQAGTGPMWWVKRRAGAAGFRGFWHRLPLLRCAIPFLRLCPGALS